MTDFWKKQKEIHDKLSKKTDEDFNKSTDLKDYKELANYDMFSNNKPHQTINNDWNLITHNDNNRLYQNRQTLELVNSIKGSHNISDFLNDGLQYLGFTNNPLQKKRQEETEEILRNITKIKKLPKLTLTGHSLGGNIANRMINKGYSYKSYNFNPFIPNKSLNIDDDRVVNIRNKNDFASTITKHNKNTLNLNSNLNSLKSHSLNNIIL